MWGRKCMAFQPTDSPNGISAPNMPSWNASHPLIVMKMFGFYLTADCHSMHHILFRVHRQEFPKNKTSYMT